MDKTEVKTGKQFLMHNNTDASNETVLFPMNRIQDVIVDSDKLTTLASTLPVVVDNVTNPTTSNGFKLHKKTTGTLSAKESSVMLGL